MTNVNFMSNENKQKKYSVIQLVISLPIGAFCSYQAISQESYMAVGFFGALAGISIMLAFIALKNLTTAKESFLISGDENGITIKTSKDNTRTLMYSEIADIKAIQKGLLNKGVVLMMKNPEEYINSLSAEEKKQAKMNKQNFKSPVAVNVSFCEKSPVEIVNALQNTRN